ncbi:PTS sugar transporter subunit IIC [Erysipelothrix sp. HDW6C]|uniref:PTS sugar transporter subunit IIC n=1 Tax=Erysipelothrix sp. HDW6C TaxID=2714930 RepID=UPI00140787DB|nr:PTS sugar transporter subunit IIC [Erysipelothrix sp. HDW6C]QIK68952.1 PTS sugar transporter subunit IIC [Erysipelothrix sp. HDW6C]
MFNKLENVLAPIAEKLSKNKVLSAIRDGFIISTPLIVVASIFLLIANFPITGYPEFMAGIFGEGWDGHLSSVVSATFDVISLLTVIGIGYSYAREKEVDRISGAVIAFVAFLIITQQSYPEYVNEAGKAFKGFSFGNLGSQGIFLAMITALLSVQIFAWVKNKGWVIKLPDGVPPAVMESFAALIPSAFVMVIFFGFRMIFQVTDFGYAHVFVYKMLQAPLMGFGEFAAFDVIYQFLSNLFWFFGINGPAVTNTVFRPIHEAMTIANLNAFELGEPLRYIFTGPFRDFFSNFGGGGSTLSLVIVMLTVGKSQRMKQLGRLSIVPGVFGINEMIIFGLPVVLNPIILIPFIFVPVINSIISTVFMSMGLIPLTSGIALPWTTPVFFSGWLSTGSIWAGVLQIGLVALGCAIYYPFFKIMDNQYLADEAAPQEKIKDELDDISLDDISFDDL